MKNLKGNSPPPDLIQVHRMALAGFLIRGLSHELNNHLTSIAGFSEGLIKRLKKIETGGNPALFGTFEEYLEIINTEAFRCQKIINRLKNFTTAPSDTREPVKVDKAVSKALELIGQAAKDKGIAIGLDTPLSKEQPRTLGNESELIHLFMTLFKMLLQSGSKGQFQVRVENTAAGIRVDIPAPKGIFTEPLMGLDFRVCQTIVQHHGWEINSCEPEEDNQIATLMIPTRLP